MEDDTIVLPREVETALLKLDQNTSDERDLIRQTIGKLLDPEDEFTQKVTELVIGSRSSRRYDEEVQQDEDGVVDILGYELDSAILEDILKSLKNLRTFTWFVNMPIPETVTAALQEANPDAQLRFFKMQKTDDANVIPQLDFAAYGSFSRRQYFDRNDFGSVVYTAQEDRRALRLQLLVPYWPVNEGDAMIEWLKRKTDVATSAIASIDNLTSVYATDYQGELGLLVPALIKHGETLRVLKLHSIPSFELDRPDGPSWLSTAETTLLASHLKALTHLEMDFQAFSTEAERMTMPFTSANPALTAVAALKSLRTLRLWIEVPTSASVFQDAYGSSDSERPLLKQDKLVQAVGNMYALLKGANPGLELEWFEVAFARLDSWDRMDAYPRFLPVRLTPSAQSAGSAEIEASEEGGGGGVGGFTIQVREWLDDFPEQDIGKLTDYAWGYL